jgi:hypothetical protein
MIKLIGRSCGAVAQSLSPCALETFADRSDAKPAKTRTAKLLRLPICILQDLSERHVLVKFHIFIPQRNSGSSGFSVIRSSGMKPGAGTKNDFCSATGGSTPGRGI